MVVRQLVRGRRARWQFDQLARGFVHAQCRRPGGVIRAIAPLGGGRLVMMNEFGTAVSAAAALWRPEPQDILLVVDDVNLPLGTLRLRPEGSSGGHHGLASCLERLGTEAVPRLRVGVGRQDLPRDLTEFVLSRFDGDERPRLRDVVTRAVEACELWAAKGIDTAMNDINRVPE